MELSFNTAPQSRRRPIHVVLERVPGGDPATWYAYQRYYVSGLRQLADVQFSFASLGDRVLAAARERGMRGCQAAWRLAAGHFGAAPLVPANLVGRYTVQFDDLQAPLRVAVDSHDGREIRDPHALEWSHLYFKVSHWPALDYGPKVQPLVCGNGALSGRRIAQLIGMRNRPKDLDLVFIAKLWPSNPALPTYWNAVEHLVRVFETLAKLPIRAHLRAVTVPLAGNEPFPRRYLDRLDRAGVPVIPVDVTVEELWRATAHAELAFLRPGKHLCVSWRMIDHLALGAATLCDRAAYPQWPVPLQQGREFLDCGVGIGMDEALPEPAEYARIADTVMAALTNRERLAGVRKCAAAYFDAHVAPTKLASHIMTVARTAAEGRQGAPAMPRNPLATVIGPGARLPVPREAGALAAPADSPLRAALHAD